MDKIESKHKEITAFLEKNSDEKIIQKLSRYFREGLDAYGIDKDIFLSQKQKWTEDWHDMSLEDYLELGDRLVATGNLEKISLAIQLIMSKREEFTKDTFELTGKWLENGIQNWANTDVMCMILLSAFFYDGIVKDEDFIPWTKSTSKWKRRAVPVTFVETFKKGYDPKSIMSVIESLMEDPEEDVQKGLGTLLREIWKKDPELAESFLMKWKDRCGRKIIQYATEKMGKEYRKKFRKFK